MFSFIVITQDSLKKKLLYNSFLCIIFYILFIYFFEVLSIMRYFTGDEMKIVV